MQATDFQEPPGHCTDVIARVVDHPQLVRHGAAIVNTDSRAYREALARKQALRAREDQITSLETTVSTLSKDIDEMKGMLKCLLQAVKSS